MTSGSFLSNFGAAGSVVIRRPTVDLTGKLGGTHEGGRVSKCVVHDDPPPSLLPACSTISEYRVKVKKYTQRGNAYHRGPSTVVLKVSLPLKKLAMWSTMCTTQEHSHSMTPNGSQLKARMMARTRPAASNPRTMLRNVCFCFVCAIYAHNPIILTNDTTLTTANTGAIT